MHSVGEIISIDGCGYGSRQFGHLQSSNIKVNFTNPLNLIGGRPDIIDYGKLILIFQTHTDSGQTFEADNVWRLVEG